MSEQVNEVAKLNFDGQEYEIDKISEQAKYAISQIQDISKQMAATRAKMDQMEMARQGFENLLRMSLNETNEKPSDEANVQ